MLAFLTPLPPVRSGIANYAAMLLPALGAATDLVAVADQAEWEPVPGVEVISAAEYRGRRGDFDRTLYQLGNNPYHEWIYDEAILRPGVAVLHEVVLHHLLVERTLARGRTAEYIAEMASMHGPAGKAWAEARAAGFHSELGNFLFPAVGAVARRSLSLVVHNRYALEVLDRQGIDTPATLVEHPLVIPFAVDGAAKRSELGYGIADRVIGVFGFVTEAKRPQVVMRAFSEAWRRDSSLRLLIVGEAAPNIDLPAMAAALRLPEEVWRATGYVADDDFDGYLAAVDAVVNLRYPTAGETSGALLRTFAAGKPVALNDYAQFSEYPAGLATMIPFGDDEVPSLVRFILHSRATEELRERELHFLAAHASLEGAVRGYLRALHAPARGGGGGEALPLLPLFPRLALVKWELERGGSAVRVRLRNEGGEIIRTAVYGDPGYRLAATLTGGTSVRDRWLALEEDLPPGETGEVTIPIETEPGMPLLVELRHAVEGIPALPSAPFAKFEVAR